MNVTETAFWGESGLLILWDTPAGRPPYHGHLLFKKGGAGVSRFGDRRQIMKKIIDM